MIDARGAALIVVARNLNPSIFSQIWLVDEGLVDHGCAFDTPSVTAQEMSQHSFQELQFLALPDRFQITFTSVDDKTGTRATTLASKIVEKLPHTPFRAIGINFEYVIRSTSEFERSLIRWPAESVAAPFSSSTARLGVIAVGSVKEAKLTLEMRPGEEAGEKTALIKFNFHFDLPERPKNSRIEALASALAQWTDLRRDSLAIAEEISLRSRQPSGA
ncbi:MAG: hypothetical protein JNJ88_13145 [Planctomycetes bacterium]|nr:hypothetical protein [Planctomycetota bacterium]